MAIKPNPTPWAVSTNTATESMTTAKSTAVAAGYTKVGNVTEKVRYVILEKFENKAPDEITNRDVVLLNQRFQDLETEINKLRLEGSIPMPREFICQTEFRSCMASASKRYEQLTCWMALAACLGRDLTTIFSKSD